MTVSEDDTDRTVDELLDWLCWRIAVDREDNYPPEERAVECCNALKDDHDVDVETRALERGWHSRAYTDAIQLFETLDRRGFDPKGRAEREIRRFNEDHDGELDEITWDWYDNRRL